MVDDLPLVCPRCRIPGPPGERFEARPRFRDGRLACPSCGTVHPVVDDVICLPPDLDRFLASQEASLREGAPPTDPSRGAQACDEASFLDPASVAFRETVLLGQHAAAQFSGACPHLHHPHLFADLAPNDDTVRRLGALVRGHPVPEDAPFPGVLDCGCGPGRLALDLADAAPSGSVGMDLRLAPLRLAARLARGETSVVPFRTEGNRFEALEVLPPPRGGAARFVAGDVLAPPFAAEAFGAVVAVSLLDTVPDPLLALGQLDALLVPGGLLLLASPWQWEPTVTPAGAWWSTPAASAEESLRTLLRGDHRDLPHLAYDVLDEADSLPWMLPNHRRLVHRYSLYAVLARKRR